MATSNMALYMRTRRAERRARLLSMRGNRCERCGSADSLEFNHLDRSTKSFDLSGAALDKAWPKIIEELNKCELLCGECHLDYTRGQYGSGEIEQWSKGKVLSTRESVITQHGMAKMYNEGCRCPDCKYAKSLYRGKSISYTCRVSILP